MGRMSLALFAAAIVLSATSSNALSAMEFPVKKTRSLTSDSEVRQIRENIAKYPKAKAIADAVIKRADEWVARSDRYIWEMIPSYDIPRGFNSSFDGCPVHGAAAFKYGNYFWKMDPFNKPWKLVCPIGGEEYPSNDFMAYYKTKDKSLLTGPYADDGWGWRKDGDKYKHWFVAYYCHWLWSNYIFPALSDLGTAYQITGDPKYARKSIVILDRIADFYPSMDHNKQSRYAQEFAPDYKGKILNLIWETGTATTFAYAYDNIFDALSSDGQFQPVDGKDSPLYGKTNQDIRGHIERDLLNDAVKSIYDGKIRGNYGMHQRALLCLATVLQDDEITKRAVDYVLNNSTGDRTIEGFNYALDNMVLREGISFESAPGYCLIWSGCMSSVAELLNKLGTNVYDNPKLKRMFTAYLDLQVMGKFTPAIGDSGSVAPGVSDLPADMARMGLNEFGDSVFAKWLLDHKVYGENTLARYSDLDRPVLDQASLEKMAKGAPDLVDGCKNLGGYGLGIMEAGKDDRRIGLACYYGPSDAGHAHFDKLFFELYGFGKKLIPDLGYPQFAAENRDRPAWETNTISHATVTVNASRQTTKKTGYLNQFAVTPDVKILDVSSPDTYPGLEEYRRVQMLIGGDTESPYMVDFFLVKGGRSHDYSLHGFDGAFTTEGIDLKPQAKGTLAGEDVPYSYLYDDPELENPDKTRSFSTYVGSGYSYLYNVSRGVPSDGWSAVWQDKDCGIRAVFPSQPVREVAIADGNPPKRPGNPDKLKYVLLRTGAADGADGLRSRFACVLQPFKPGDPAIRVKRLPAESGDLLEVTGAQGTDYVYLAEDPSKTVRVGGLTIGGTCAVLRMDAKGALRSAFIGGGGDIKQSMLSIESAPSITGAVSKVNYKSNEVELSAGPKSEIRNPHLGTVLFGRANYTVHSAHAKGGKLVIGLGEDSPRIGKLAVDVIGPDGDYVTTKSILQFASAGCYKDRWLVNEDHTAWHRIADVSGGKITLAGFEDLRTEFTDKNGDGHATAYLYDIAPGQEFTIPASCWVGKDSSGKWQVESNTPAKISLPDGTALR